MKRFCCVLALFGALGTELSAQNTVFTYQGRLQVDGQPAHGIYDLRFILFTADAGGSQVGPFLTNAPVAVSGGLFSVPLDFGTDAFHGPARWLEIAVRTNGSAEAFATLSPRQPITSAPFALHAANAMALMTFINAPLDIKVNGARVLRLESTGSNSANVVGGYAGNSVAAGVVGATIGGGGAGDYSGFTLVNRVEGDFGTVGGGFWNTASNRAATVAGGSLNNASGGASSIGGGDGNTASDVYTTVSGGGANVASGLHATIGGGYLNIASGYEATVAGGFRNTASGDMTAVSGGWENIASGSFARVGGGRTNIASGLFASSGGGASNIVSGYSAVVGGGWFNRATNFYAAVGGGRFNTARGVSSTIAGGFSNDGSGSGSTIAGGDDNAASGSSATVGGGDENTSSGSASTIAGGYQNRATNIWSTVGGGSGNLASGYSATVPGGFQNTAQGSFSFAAGYRAKAIHDGSFVWADSRNFDFASNADDKVRFRCSSGFDIITAINGSGVPTAGVYLSPGDSSWNAVSDRERKENFQTVNPLAVLDKVAALPISRWNYKSNPTQEHLGPMAQDFHAAFGLGPDDKHISSIDVDGVALAAIQGLNRKVDEQRVENADLKRRLAELERLVSQLTRQGE
jgi:trimeric autotransporter adhesin